MAEVKKDQLEDEAAVAQKSRGVALADEAPDELPALLAIAVGIAILAITIVWPSIANRERVETAPAETAAEVVEQEEQVDATPAPELLTESDLGNFNAGLASAGLAAVTLSGIDTNVVIATGEVADEAAKAEILQYLNAQPKVDSVVDELTIAAVAESPQAESKITAGQSAVVLTGTVPDEATEAALVDRATAIWNREGQVDNQLVIDADKQAPTKVTIEGQVSDPGLFGRIQSGFGDIEGVEVDAAGFTLSAESDLEAGLNALAPIEFSSGSALIRPESEPILDEAAALLKASPGIAVEIGGHTDSRGSDESNQTLSESRAASVKAALEEREVENELTAVGYGEERLREPNDADDVEAQQRNRRIEYREQ